MYPLINIPCLKQRHKSSLTFSPSNDRCCKNETKDFQQSSDENVYKRVNVHFITNYIISLI